MAALTFYRNENKNVPQHEDELVALKKFINNKNLIIQKLDEGKSVGVIDRQLLIGIHNRMELMLSYQCKFLKVDFL